VYVCIEPAIPPLQNISTSSSVSLTAADFLNASIINQVDRKFILITIPTSTATVVALVDQHAADERFRLETIIKSLQTTIHRLSSEMKITLPSKVLETLSHRRNHLLSWGIDISVTEDGLRITGIPEILMKDLDEARWKGILSSYVTTNVDDCPRGLMEMFCSKACRSVHPPSMK
jgi:DNA mismatch repair ATPase MutL